MAWAMTCRNSGDSRAISNLLSNAVNLAPPGSTVTIAAGSRAGWAWVAVQDEGPGIAEPDQDAVFDRFHRGSPTDTPRRHRGSGLVCPSPGRSSKATAGG